LNWRSKSSTEKFNGFFDYGTSFTGELTFEGTFRIDGEFHGSITTADILIVGPRAAVHADIKAGEVTVHGSVFGNIECSRRVEIGATGRLRGDVRTAQFVVEEGAIFEGWSRTTLELKPAAEETLLRPNQPERPAQPERASPQSEKSLPEPEKTFPQPERPPAEPERSHPPEKKRWREGFLP
jgi:cytoskeletal protein CcmA (bactofilin family)